MDAPSAESRLRPDTLSSWLARNRATGRVSRYATWGVGIVLLATVVFSVWLLGRGAQPGTLLSPPVIAVLLVANLIPAIALMVLFSRRVARRRAEREGLGSGKLHARLVTLFSVLAAVPTVFVVIFASLLFQSGLEFWFSDRARGMLENTVQVAQSTYRIELGRVGAEATAMSGNVAEMLQQVSQEDPRFKEALAYQVYLRSLNEAAILEVEPTRQLQTIGVVNAYEGMIDEGRIKAAVAKLKGTGPETVVDAKTPNRISVLTRLSYGPNSYLYVSRWVDPEIEIQIRRANEVLDDYRALLERSRVNQLRFNGALLLGSLVIVALAILAALKMADRIVRPVGHLVTAAGRIEEGDFSVRVPVKKTEDEVQTLASAFNRMTGRLEEQTGALKAANTQLDARRAFTEAVLSSVTAGVVSVRGRMLTLLDPATLLGTERAGRAFRSDSSIIVLRGDEQLALAVNRVERNIEVRADDIAPPAEDLSSAVVCGVVRSEHRHTVVLDARELFAAATHGEERRRQRT